MILNRLAEDLGEMAMVEQRPQQDGRNMTMMLAPARVAENEDGSASAAAAAEAEKAAKRKPPKQKPAGSADAAEINPQQI
jgi:translation initiation factor IF-3